MDDKTKNDSLARKTRTRLWLEWVPVVLGCLALLALALLPNPVEHKTLALGLTILLTVLMIWWVGQSILFERHQLTTPQAEEQKKLAAIERRARYRGRLEIAPIFFCWYVIVGFHPAPIAMVLSVIAMLIWFSAQKEWFRRHPLY